MTSSPRIAFFGTPDFSVPFLHALHERYGVLAVVTQPDAPQGRKRVLTASPVKEYANEHGISVLQPRTFKKDTAEGRQFREALQALSLDVAVVFAYGKILPQTILSTPRLGCINIHPSLLPELRGPSPIQFAILRGYTETGVTIMRMDKKMDTGPILSSRVIPLSPTDTTGSVYAKVQEIGIPALLETIPAYLEGRILPKPQDDSRATYCSLIQKTDGQIHWEESPQQIDRHIRAYTPWPGAYTFCQEKRVKICRAHLQQDTLIIDEVQPEGKRIMPYEEFLRGYPQCRF